jgi:hypothetical protein
MSNHVEVMKMDGEANVKGVVIVSLAVKGIVVWTAKAKL